jgi:putative hemolysin
MLSESLVILVLILTNGFFAGAEIAVIALRKTRVMELQETGRTSARAVWVLRQQPERFLATVQIGITVVSTTAAAFGGASIAERLTPILARFPWLAPHADEVALGLVIAGVAYFSIVLGELVPKSLALRSAEQYALLVGKPLLALAWLARPLVWLLSASANLVLKPFGDRTTFTEARHSAEELQQLVEEAMEAGTIHPDAGIIAARALELPELTAADVMVPSQDVVMLPRHASPEEIQRILIERPYSRLPVYEGRIDNVVGYVTVKDLLPLAWEQKLIVVEDVMRPPFFVPEFKLAVDLLRDMRKRHAPFAIVVDEQGGMAGIVTMEDLVEELVGEIFSEHVAEAPRLIRKEADGSAVVSGTAPIREINRALGVELPEDGPWTTVAGLYLALTGRIPNSGEVLTLSNGVVLQVLEASPRRVETVRVRAPANQSKSERP